VKGKPAEYSSDSKKMLEIDLRGEQETIRSYRERIRQAEAAGNTRCPRRSETSSPKNRTTRLTSRKLSV